jgi:hypothetical protein
LSLCIHNDKTFWTSRGIIHENIDIKIFPLEKYYCRDECPKQPGANCQEN